MTSAQAQTLYERSFGLLSAVESLITQQSTQSPLSPSIVLDPTFWKLDRWLVEHSALVHKNMPPPSSEENKDEEEAEIEKHLEKVTGWCEFAAGIRLCEQPKRSHSSVNRTGDS